MNENDVPKTYVSVNGTLVEGDLAPDDRVFRNAWVLNDKGAIVIDMEKAKEIHIENLRRERQEEFSSLDVQYQRADEENDEVKKKKIVERKKLLRSLPDDPRFNKVKKPEDLVELTYEVLTK